MLTKDIQTVFTKAAATFDEYAVLHTEVRKRLLLRAQVLAMQPARILDLGAGTCIAASSLASSYPEAQLFSLDLTPAMLQKGAARRTGLAVCADYQALPFAAQSIDLVFSNLAIHWCKDFNRLLWELRVAMTPGATFLFSVFGPRTLSELRDAWSNVDRGHHVHEFHDIHDLGDAILGGGFVDPLMDVDVIQLTYNNLEALLGDIRKTGGQNIQPSRPRGLLGKTKLEQLKSAYEQHRFQGTLPATCEIVYGMARAPSSKTTK